MTKILAAILSLAIATVAWTCDDDLEVSSRVPSVQDREPGKQSERPSVSLVLSGGVETAYDDNILDLTKSDIRLLKSGNQPTEFRISTEDDFVVTPFADVGLALGEKGDTVVGLYARQNFYLENGIMNYTELEAYLRHRFGESDTVRLSLYSIPKEYSRQLPDPVTGAFRPANYYLIEGSLRWAHEFSKMFELSPRFALGRKSYESPFAFRSTTIYTGALRGTINFAEQFSLVSELQGSYSVSDATGDEPDVSNLMTRGGVTAVTRWFDRTLELDARYRLTLTDYTTAHSVSSDPGFADRLDVTSDFMVRAIVTVSNHLEIFLRYDYTKTTSNANSTPALEQTDYERNVVTLGITLSN